jgi:hypothetical protein
MTAFITHSIIAAILLAAAGSAYGVLAHGGPIGASAVSLAEVGERDKTRTSAGLENGKGAQWAKTSQMRAAALWKRRAGDSNPQPLAGHLISSQAAGQFAYPPDRPISIYTHGFARAS